MPAWRRLVESPGVGEEHLAAGGHGTPPRNAAQFRLKMIALEKDTTMQRLLCISINNLLEANGSERLADEAELPRGGAAHKRK